MDQSLISVIVPAYNAEKWVEACCRSVFAQSYTNWELIVVNDGSTDDTGRILHELARENPKMRLISTENGGVCRARNLGLAAANGSYITFLDADDMLKEEALEYLCGNLVRNGGDIAIGWKTNIKPDGTELGCPYEKESALWTGLQSLESSLRDHPATYSVWGKLYARHVVADVRFSEGRKVHEDSFFLFECLLKQPKVVLTDSCVLYYRLSENSASRAAFSEKLFDILFFAEQKYDRIMAQYPQLGPLAENMMVKAHMSLLWNLCTTTDPVYRRAEKASIRAVIRKKAYFVKAIGGDQKWFFVITHHLYPIYKAMYQIRKKIHDKQQ